MQFKLAEKNATMAIFLGKQPEWLNQQDNSSANIGLVESPKIQVEIVDNSNLEKELYR